MWYGLPSPRSVAWKSYRLRKRTTMTVHSYVTSVSDTKDELEALLADSPALEAEFETVLEVDEAGPWDFDDVPLDSGTFGEVVSRGIVESVDGNYRVADRAAVRAALEGEPIPEDQSGGGSRPRGIPELPEIDGRALRPLGVGLVVLFLVRSYMYPAVFRPEAITFLGNDPYFYRYWILELARAEAGVFAVPEAFQIGEPLLVATVWTVTTIFGGDAATGFVLLAWYPVAAALVSGVFVYFLAVFLTQDRRVGLATLVLLAVTPVLGYRTALGFADHHAFDLVWLALTMAAIAWLAGRHPERSVPTTSLAIIGVAIGVSGQVLAWNAGALLLVPIAVYGVIHAAIAVRDNRSVVRALGPVTLGVAGGAGIAWIVHLQWGWQSQYMVLAPTLLAAGLVGVLFVAEGGRRLQVSAPVVTGGLLGVGVLIVFLTTVSFPEFTAEAVDEVTQLVVKSGQEDIAEVKSIFSTDYGFIAGPFFFFGVSLFFAIPYLVWGIWYGIERSRPAWIVASTYGLVFFVLGVIRVRFAGQLALIAAIFSGLALVHLYSIVTERGRPDVLSGSRPDSVVPVNWSRPERSTVFALVGIFLLVGGLGTMMTPLRVNLLIHSEAQYDAAIAMDEYAETEDWEYPQSYVFSKWGDNRMYNALVSGESRSYGFARSNYEAFITSPNGSDWYERLEDRGFVVTTDIDDSGSLGPQTMYSRLHRDDGRETGHYRLVYTSADESVKVFTLVEGVTVTGTTAPNKTIAIAGEMETTPEPISVEWTVTANSDGQYSVAISSPGRYQIDGHAVTVNDSAVASGTEFVVS